MIDRDVRTALSLRLHTERRGALADASTESQNAANQILDLYDSSFDVMPN